MRSLRTILMFLFAMVFTISVQAKEGDVVPGYIVKENGKKVKGKIKIGDIAENEVKVTFIASGKKKTYKAKDISGYGFQISERDDAGNRVKRWVHFETAQVDMPPRIFASTTVFMEREVAGAISLYTYYVEVRNNPKEPYKYWYYVKGIDGKLTKVNRNNYRKIAKNLFKDYTALASNVGKRKFSYRNLDRMVRDYNYWLDNQHNADEYRVAMKN